VTRAFPEDALPQIIKAMLPNSLRQLLPMLGGGGLCSVTAYMGTVVWTTGIGIETSPFTDVCKATRVWRAQRFGVRNGRGSAVGS